MGGGGELMTFHDNTQMLISWDIKETINTLINLAHRQSIDALTCKSICST